MHFIDLSKHVIQVMVQHITFRKYRTWNQNWIISAAFTDSTQLESFNPFHLQPGRPY